MPRTRVVISLLRTRLEAARLERGGVAASVSRELDPELFEERWRQGLSPLDEPLREALETIGGLGARARVLAQSPETTSQVVSLPVEGKRALEGARLSLADSAPFSLEGNPNAVRLLGTDRSGSPKQTHVLCVAERAAQATAIEDLLRRVGCRLESIAPADGTALSSVVRRMLERETRGVEATLHLGDQTSVFAAASDGCLHFVRKIDLGVDLLIEALTRSIEPRRRPDEQVRLSRAEARSLLYEFGVPGPKEDVDERRELVGADVLPLMQPVLQRFVVEIKQSLRFGLGDAQRATTTLSIEGAGATIPGISGVLSGETELAVEEPRADGVEKGEDARRRWSPVSLSLGDGAMDVNLLSPKTARDRASKRVERSLWWGAAAAGALLAAQGGWMWSSLQETQRSLQAVQPAAERARQAANAEERAREAAVRLASTSSKIRGTIGQRINWEGWLGELSRITPERVRLTELTTSLEREGATAQLKGYALGAVSGRMSEALTEYIETLRDCQLVKSVELGATQRAGLESQEAQRFQLSVELVSAPATLPWEETR